MGKETQQFYIFYPKLSPLAMGVQIIDKFFSPYPTETIYQIWFRLAQ